MKTVESVEELKEIEEDSKEKYILKNDINGKGERISPIDNLKGSIDGNGHEIRNLIIEAGNDRMAGLVIDLEGEIKNLKLRNVEIKGEDAIGAFAATTRKASLENCEIINSVIKGDYISGGLIGETSIDTRIENCEVRECEVEGRGYIGGLIGHSISGDIIECKVKSSLVKSDEDDSYTGGFIGLRFKDNKVDKVEVIDTKIERGKYTGSLFGWCGEKEGPVGGNIYDEIKIRYYENREEVSQILL